MLAVILAILAVSFVGAMLTFAIIYAEQRLLASKSNGIPEGERVHPCGCRDTMTSNQDWQYIWKRTMCDYHLSAPATEQPPVPSFTIDYPEG